MTERRRLASALTCPEGISGDTMDSTKTLNVGLLRAIESATDDVH